MDDGTVSGFRGRDRYNRLAAKRRIVDRFVVFCPDGTKRKMLGHRDIRMEFWLWDLLFWNPTYNAIPILSEPIGTYDIRELKTLVAKNIHRFRQSICGGGEELRLKVKEASTFDDLLDIVTPEPATS